MSDKPLRGYLPIIGTLAGGLVVLAGEAWLSPPLSLDLLMLVPVVAALVFGWLGLLVERGLS